VTERRLFFATPEDFRDWLAANHETQTEQHVGFHKTGSGRPSITWPQSVRQALCFGWIDGVRRSIDADSYEIRFTPRRPRSTWSAVNIRLATELIESGEMQPAGLAAFEARTESNSVIYSYENDEAALSEPFHKRLRADSQAAAFFDSQPPSYRRTAIHWVMRAKRPETRERRLATLIEDSRNGLRIGPLRRS
jgi:uncharacterized protein YdeI (YjbR/CyaY-like superfamily)